jgi:hypothetical protein
MSKYFWYFIVQSMDLSQSAVGPMNLFAPKNIEGFCIHWKHKILSGTWIYIKHNLVSSMDLCAIYCEVHRFM